MNLLIINDCGVFGSGTEIRIRLLVEELLKSKIFNEIHILEHELSETAFGGVFVHRCGTKNSGIVTRRIIKECDISIVQVHNLSAISTRPIVAAKKLNKPVIFFLHDYWPFCGRRYMFSKWGSVCKTAGPFNCVRCIGIKSFFNTLRNKKHLNLCDVGIAPSNFCIERYEQHNILKNKWVKVLPWIDGSFTSRIKNVKREKNVILFVGPLTKPKGAQLIARALKHIKKSIPEIKLRYVGCAQERDNPDRKKIEKILIEDSVIDNAEFLGEKSAAELKKEYAKAAVYVCCPLWNEVFGQTWAQALCCRTPVVATNVGSIPELASVKTVKPDCLDLANAILNLINKENNQNVNKTHWPTASDVLERIKNVYFELGVRYDYKNE